TRRRSSGSLRPAARSTFVGFMTLLTIAEVAKMLRVSAGQIYNLRSAGDFPPGFKVGRSVLYDADEIRAYLEAHREPVSARRLRAAQ
ncbi:MAG: helix-turn-helix transcriptional regulator, partial [Actinomycetota bacterium]